MTDHNRRGPRQLTIVSTSAAADLGYCALQDVANAAEAIDYRIVGGQMVALLLHAYPVSDLQPRATRDADAGVDFSIAAEHRLHDALVDGGYSAHPTYGNRYIKSTEAGDRYIDVLIPARDNKLASEEVGGRSFDLVPGLRFAISSEPLEIRAAVRLTSDEWLQVDARIPDVEAAVVLKACAWASRSDPKDVADLATLFEIVNQHKAGLVVWGLGGPKVLGARLDAVRALTLLRSNIHSGMYDRADLPIPPARLSALISEHIGRSG